MPSVTVPSFHSETMLAQHHTAAAFAEVAPWRGILAVGQDVAALNAGVVLLTKSNYCVTPATSYDELFIILRDVKATALAMLSDRLGRYLLEKAAATIRRQWPRTRILIIGKAAMVLEDHLYDEQIDRSSDPQQVLADLERLYEGMWNQGSRTLDWNATASRRWFARPPISESDPTKTINPVPTAEESYRDKPSDMRLPVAKAHDARLGFSFMGAPVITS